MRIFILSIFCLFVLNLSAQISKELSDKLDYDYDSLCTKLHIKGSSAAIIIPNVGTWKRHYGVSYASKNTDTEMLFTLGSNTKTYTASVVLKLHQLGLLSINDTIGKWFKNVTNVKGSIKISQLLNHTGGIASYTDNNALWTAVNADLSKKWTMEEIVPYIGTPTFSPGANWAYSNSNFLLAGIIIKQVTGKSLAEAYRTYIFTPANLTKTFLLADETTGMDVAHHWSNTIGNPYLTDWEALGLSYVAMNSVANAAGGLYATAEENAKFFDALFNTKLIIDDSMISKMKTFKSIGNGAGYGFGLFGYFNFNGRTVYSHGGTNLGGINENLYDPTTKCTISVLSNQDSVSNNTILTEIIYNLHKDLINAKASIENINAFNDLLKVYPNPSKGVFQIEKEPSTTNDEIIMSISDMSGQKVMDINSTAFYTNNKMSIDSHSLSSGIYFLHVQMNNKTFVKKLVLVSE